VQGNFVAPLVFSRAVNLHPAIVLLAVPAGNEIAGIVGMFLAVPVVGVIAATWRPLRRAFADDMSVATGPAPAAEAEPGEPVAPAQPVAPRQPAAATADPPGEVLLDVPRRPEDGGPEQH
jgi:hypothetical protein